MSNSISNIDNNINNNNHDPSSSSSPPSPNSSQSKFYDHRHPMQSIAVITLAGFGGAMAGLSMKRNTMLMKPTLYYKQSNNNIGFYYEKLPFIWSIGCATFAGIVEFSTLISPTKGLISLWKHYYYDDDDDNNNEYMYRISDKEEKTNIFQNRLLYWDEESTTILGDYALGGAFAGALFKGSQLSQLYPTSTTATTTTTTTTATEATSTKVVNATAYKTLASTSPSSSTTTTSLTSTEHNNISEGSLKQKRIIGQGKVITLTNNNNKNDQQSFYDKRKRKSHYNDNNMNLDRKKVNNNIQIQQQSHNTSISTAKTFMKDNLNSNKSSIIQTGKSIRNRGGILAGLLPGLSLGILAGIIQISLLRLSSFAQDYDDNSGDEEKSHHSNNTNNDNSDANDDHQKVDILHEEDDDIVKQVKLMSTEEIKREIQRLKGIKNNANHKRQQEE